MKILLIALIFSALLSAGLLPPAVAKGVGVSSVSSLKIVFTAASRDPVLPGSLASGGAQMIYTMGPGTSNIRQITSFDGYTYDWSTWAFGGTKIVYTSRSISDSAAGENLFLMNPDGSDRIQLTYSTWRNVQPKVSPDGMSVLFTAQWPEFPSVALFKLDLRTLTVINQSAARSSIGARESDPRWAGDGTSIVFADTADESGAVTPTQIYQVDSAGGRRRRLTVDSYWNTDPALSPDGTRLAVSSYRGPGTPHREGAKNEFTVKFQDWHLVVIDPATGSESVLTQGLPCATRVAPAPACSSTEGPAWIPLWSPDGQTLGYISMRSLSTMGIYAIAPEGGTAWPIFETTDLAISWWDWIDTASSRSATAPVIGTRLDAGLLIGGGRGDTEGVLVRSTADRWFEAPVVPAVPGLVPRFARWTADRKHIIFTARRLIDAAEGPPVLPASHIRHVRYTLPEFTAEYELAPDRSIAEEQVYVMDSGGQNVRQITTPWIEDSLEAPGDGDIRANIEPDVSPDGRYVIFTNVSTSVDETMILRLDVATGDVLNLSSMTAGALTVRDSAARFSPDGTQIAFSSIIGATRQLFLMWADGTGARQVTNDDNDNSDPAWSPDGTSLAFSSYQADTDPGAGPTAGWSIVRLDIASGRLQTLTNADESPAFRPVWSPDGRTIAYISTAPAPAQPDLRLVDADGSHNRLLVTLLTREAFVDWR